MSPFGQASRVDPETGTREFAAFIGRNRNVFTFTHLPGGDAIGGVVVCSPLYAEFQRNYRREVLIGRRLASKGVAVQRFHYRGHGHSERIEPTFQSMREDAIAAAHHLAGVAGLNTVVLFGTRWGALVAAAASGEFHSPPLAFWDPVLEPTKYLRDIYRAHRIQALKERTSDGTSATEMFEVLTAEGSVEVLGYSIGRPLFESSRTSSLAAEVGLAPRPLLIVELGVDARLHTELGRLIASWISSGFDVTSRVLGTREAWWFTSGALVDRESLTEPVDATVEWFGQLMGFE